MPDPTVSRRVVTDALITRLRQLGDVTVYRAHVPDRPPIMSDAVGAPDTLGRIAPYVVVYPSAGSPDPGDADLADCHVDLAYTCQTTLAAGSAEDLDHLVDRLVPHIFRWTPDLPDVNTSGFRPIPGFDPGPHRRDDSIDPPRWWTPLQWRLIATT